ATSVATMGDVMETPRRFLCHVTWSPATVAAVNPDSWGLKPVRLASKPYVAQSTCGGGVGPLPAPAGAGTSMARAAKTATNQMDRERALGATAATGADPSSWTSPGRGRPEEMR